MLRLWIEPGARVASTRIHEGKIQVFRVVRRRVQRTRNDVTVITTVLEIASAGFLPEVEPLGSGQRT